MTNRAAIVLSGWQVAALGGALLAWFAGDYLLLSMIDPAAFDCLASDTRSARKLEVFICSPQLLREGAVGWLTFMWLWGPIAAIGAWMAGRGSPKEQSR